AAHPGLVDQLDEPELVQGAHVVGDGAEAGFEDLGELDRTGPALVEQREDAHPQRVAHRLDISGVLDAGDGPHESAGRKRDRMRWRRTLAVPSGIPSRSAASCWVRSCQ